MTLDAYNAAQILQSTPLCKRADWLQEQSANIIHPDPQAMTWEEDRAIVDHLKVRAEGATITEAIGNWITAAVALTPRRATDGRPICPFNGQTIAQLPSASTPPMG